MGNKLAENRHRHDRYSGPKPPSQEAHASDQGKDQGKNNGKDHGHNK